MSRERFDKIDDKLDRLDEHLSRIDATLAKQAVELEHHIKRTDLLEEQVKPVVDHVIFVKVLIRILGAVAVVAGILKAFSLI